MQDDNIPVLIGAGQFVEREAGASSPMELAAQASAAALKDCGAADVASAIDTICVTKIFSDMGRLWDCKWGRSNNPPQSVAKRIGATPQHRIYTDTGGNGPQSRIIEFAADIAKGERSLVLMTGTEALKNQRHAERNGVELDWNEEFDEPLDDRGFGHMVATRHEVKSGLNNVAFYYCMIEQAQRQQKGLSVDEHRAAAAQLLESFSAVAANNPYAQFTGQQSQEEILAATNLSHLYTKRMIAQDGVNQSAALLLCSVGKARELGIPESKWVYLHGMAEGIELELVHRDDPASSPMAGLVARQALEMAKVSTDDIGSIDIYSCFPCAVVTVAEQLGLPTDGSRQLTSTGGLPYFGGPGNNYSMHAIAEAVHWSRANPEQFALVTCNGGVLSKHASGVFSQQVCETNWGEQATNIDNTDLVRRDIALDPGAGHIASYCVNPTRDGGYSAFILGETANGERFIASTAADDRQTGKEMWETDPSMRKVVVSAPIEEKLHFTLAE